ncbi:alpha/beta fold hydrolase [Streptomyces sp. I6]|uniref:alpha/beta fold hydrolase n=1 Tax=Streptomyces sp. I6 TaxID=2483113 RepID=UPI0037D9D1FB
MAVDSVGLLDHLGIDSAHVVGRSMGGMIAQTVAATRSARVRTLTSIYSTTGRPSVGRPTRRVWIRVVATRPLVPDSRPSTATWPSPPWWPAPPTRSTKRGRSATPRAPGTARVAQAGQGSPVRSRQSRRPVTARVRWAASRHPLSSSTATETR